MPICPAAGGVRQLFQIVRLEIILFLPGAILLFIVFV